MCRVLFRTALLLGLGRWALMASTCVAQSVLLESAQLGTTGRIGGSSITISQHIGWRFSIDQPLEVVRVGGHLLTIPTEPGEIFAALVRLPALNAFPQGAPLTPDETIATTTFRPNFPSDEYLTPLSAILPPGNYALLFGTNLFGATGAGGMHNGPDQPDISPTTISSYIFWGIARPNEPPLWRTDLASNLRFVIEARVYEAGTDFDVDGDADGDDLAQWIDDFGSGSGSDADKDGDSDGDDFLRWQREFGENRTLGGSRSIPEPDHLGAAVAIAGCLARRRRIAIGKAACDGCNVFARWT